MTLGNLPYDPIEGKTYSLFGDSNDTREYYQTIRSLADKVLINDDIENVLFTLQKYSSRKRYLKKIVRGRHAGSLISYCLLSIHDYLKPYTRSTADHLKNLPLRKVWDRRLATTEEQYHLYMLEIELTNRRNRDLFLSADHKISLQPYCLKDLSATCKAKPSGSDYQCAGCSKQCYQHAASQILTANGIESFIWMGSSISEKAIAARMDNKSFGLLGIACIPELVWGMRKCSKHGIPAVGIPLNGNRCVRWFGEFHPNSIDLSELESLLEVN